MSLAAMKACWDEDFPDQCPGIAPALVRAVALALADVVNAEHHDEFYGSISRLAAKARVGRKTATVVVGHLAAAGVLAVVQERPGRTTRYRWLGIPDPRPVDAGTAAEPESSRRGTRVQSTRDPRPVDARSQENRDVYQGTLTGPDAEAPVGDKRVLDAACPTCKEPAGSRCVAVPGNPHRTPLGHHSKRVARVVVSDWYDHVKAATGYPPTAPSWAALSDMVQKLITTGRRPNRILDALIALESEGRTITGTTIRAQMDGRHPKRSERRPSHDARVAALEDLYDENGMLPR